MKFITEKDLIYATDTDGKVIAEVTFPTQDGISVIDHTFVDNSFRGQGIAGELVRLAAERIVANGNKITATCPYAVIWLQRHPEYTVADKKIPVACRLDKREK